MFLRKIFLISIFTLFTFSVLGYGLYKATPIILGPKIELYSPKEFDIAEGKMVFVRGTVYRTKALYINGIPTAFTESGNFETRLAIFPGSNILIIEAVDRFGRPTTLKRSVGAK